MLDYTQHVTKYDVAKQLDVKLDKWEYAKLDHFCAGLAALYSMLHSEKEYAGNLTRQLFERLAKMDLRMACMENQLASTRVTDSDDIYVNLKEITRLSGYERKRCKQLMVGAIASGEIRTRQLEYVTKQGKNTESRVSYHLGDCKRFWSPARVKKTPAKKKATRQAVTA